MKSDSGRSVSLWEATVSLPPSATLEEELHADVCIVGAGISGISTAYLLAREGKSVVVLDDGPVGGGETCHTTAHLSNAIDDRYVELERLHGREGAALAAESHTAAIDRIEAIVAELDIDCDFARIDGYLFVPPGESAKLLDDELQAAHRAGLRDVEMVNRAPLEGFDTGPCLRFPRQGQFHPMKYLARLGVEIQRHGGRIYSGAHVVKVEGGDRVETKDGRVVHAGAAVVATNTPMNDQYVIHTKLAPYRTFAIGARVPRGSVTSALYWDTPDPYHYVRLQRVDAHPGMDGGQEPGSGPVYDMLIVGGEDHKTGHADDADERYEKLERWARAIWPQMEEVEFEWSGQVMETIDGLAFIGPNPKDKPNVYIATGDSGHGMTHGTIAGILLTDLIMGRPNKWAQLYDPARKTVRAAGEYLRENLDVAASFVDYAKPAEVNSTDEILPGWGAILRRGLKLVAVHRDQHGRLHEHSAVCPHMGCVVRWNSQEQSWDCPCHGSRFAADGHVLNGPAFGGMAPAPQVEEPSEAR